MAECSKICEIVTITHVLGNIEIYKVFEGTIIANIIIERLTLFNIILSYRYRQSIDSDYTMEHRHALIERIDGD